MTQSNEIEELAKELQLLAQQGNFELLAQKLPTPEQLTEFMQRMFENPEVIKKFDEQILQK